MKKIFSLFTLSLLVVFMATMVFAAPTLAPMFNRQSEGHSQGTTLYSGTTGTIMPFNTNYAVFDYPMNNLACDFVVSANSGSYVVSINGNQGSSVTSYPTNTYLITSLSISSSATDTVLMVSRVTGTPFRIIRGTVQSTSAAGVIMINCNGVQ